MKTINRIALLTAFAVSAVALAQADGTAVRRRDLVGGSTLLPSDMQATSAAKTYYVSAAGSNLNNCTNVATPCLTIQGAIDKVPKIIRHPITVSVGAGNFAGAYIAGFKVTQPATAAAGAYLDIVGTLANSTLATGAATGTATGGTAGSGGTGGTLVDAAATWTGSDLVGRLVVITAGTGIGQIRPIIANDATSVTISGTWTAPTGTSTYAIQDSSSIVNAGVMVPATPTGAVGTSAIGFFLYSNLADDSNAGSSGFPIVVQKFKITTIPTGIFAIGSGSRFLSRYNQILVTSTGVQAYHGAVAGVDANVINFSGAGSIGVNISSSAAGRPTSNVRMTSTFINGVTMGLSITSANDPLVTGTTIWPTGTNPSGIAVLGVVSNSQFNSLNINCASIAGSTGINIAGGSTGAATGSSFGSTDVSSISNCVAAVIVAGANRMRIPSAWTGTGNTTGYVLTEGAGLNLGSGVTLAGTTEVVLDGVAYTLTQMRALVPKRITNVATGTSFYE